ncbi:Transmembrane protease serine 9 [Orchesella cincta]|uniref:Transmembrane protease serine 9 n=1 Tax=Orchesella cincta TaxID=48709 RepID=A0A1D2N4M7_ORCCI|nr:Transmembrane protease serine 9 [Orchesella cincta]
MEERSLPTMKLLVIFAVFANNYRQTLCAPADAGALRHCGQYTHRDPKIVGGVNAANSEFPWMASFKTKYGHFCSGFVVAETFLISAAHCFHNNPYLDYTSDRFVDLTSLNVTVGEYSLKNQNEATEIVTSLKKIHLHPHYDPKQKQNDIAVLEIADGISKAPEVSPVCLPNEDYSKIITKGTKATVVGWGKLNHSQNYNDWKTKVDQLKKVDVTIWDTETCVDRYKDFLEFPSESFLCAGEKGKESCEGDSGSPLMHLNSEGVWTAIGIVANVAEDIPCDEVNQFERNSRILGGLVAGEAEFPFLASIQNSDGRHFCGATIISNKFLLTSAHCFIDSMFGSEAYKEHQILVGSNDWADKSNASNLFKISKVIIHPQYSYLKPNVENDIAVLKLDRPLQWTPRIKPICLANSAGTDNEVGTIAGWGVRSLKESVADWLRDTTLHKVSLPIWTNAECQTVYRKHRINWNTKASHICAGYQQEDRDTCQGDSGSPLFLTNENGAKVAYGIVSVGEGCGKLPGIYTRKTQSLLCSNYIAFPTEIQCGRRRAGRIINGTVTNAFPWMASIKENDFHSCGATIISSKFLLSAAHCFDTLTSIGQIIEIRTNPLLSKWSITLGEFNMLEEENHEITLPIERLIFNANYNRRHCINDIVLIELRDEIIWTNHIQPICLPQEDVQKYDSAIAAGWGRDFTKNLKHPEDNSRLRFVELAIYDNDKCNHIYQERSLSIQLHQTQMCAGTKYANEAHDTNDGDSGGPLFVNLGGREVVVGITSKGTVESIHPKAPGIYTRVYQFLHFINSHIHSTTLLANNHV